MTYCKNYCEEKGISTSKLNEAQKTLYYIAENMKIDKSISEEGYRHFQMAIKALEQEPCNDAISREAVLKIFGYVMDYWKEHAIDVEPHEIEDALIEQYEFTAKQLSDLPPVTPSQPDDKIGHWIRFKEFENGYYHIKCSECGQYWSVDGHAKIFKYCFNCRAKMESEERNEA